jgi:hypothetical protein
MTRTEELHFRRGYYLAAALCARWGEIQTAEQLLKDYGPVTFAGVDEMDAEALLPIAKSIARMRNRLHAEQTQGGAS